MSLKKAVEYAKYKIVSDTEFGIHSPFLFEFATKVIYEHAPFYAYGLIETIRKKYLADTTIIEIEDFGAGSKIFKDNKRRIKDICKYSVKPAKYGQLLFRMVNYFQPSTTLELGTCLGITTSYLGAAHRKGQVITIEADPSTFQLAQQTFSLARANNILAVKGIFTEELPKILAQVDTIDFVFIDGHHAKQPTINYFEMCLAKSTEKTIFVFDDINWSQDMKAAWAIIKSREEVTVTIDLHVMGIVFLRKELTKQNFILKF